MRGRIFVGLIGLVVAVLTGCSAANGSGQAAQGGGDYNQADVTFSQQMIPHHQQSIQIAALVAQRSQNKFVADMAEEITTKENAEIETMSGWLRTWNAEMPATGGHAGHAMPGMLTAEEITALEGATGESFDRMWLATLSKHLGNGVQMAKTVLSSGSHAGTKALAQQIVTTQEAEIAEIKGHLA